MPELTAILVAKRESDYEERKFLAAIQGIDLDKESKKNTSSAWEDMKARVFSGGSAQSSNDILAMQGVNAQKAGFGIGMGIEYSDAKSEGAGNPLG
jgi:translation initiation factor 1 (eIF-1/SUI1)